MKVHVLGYSGYDYIGKKDGKRHHSKNLIVRSLESHNENDGKGNFTFGHIVDQIWIRDDFILDDYQILELIGKDVDLIYEQQLGRSIPQLVDIKPI